MMDEETNVSSPSPPVQKANGGDGKPEAPESSPKTPVAGRGPRENRETPSSVRQRRSALTQIQISAAANAESTAAAAAPGFAIEIGDVATIRSPISDRTQFPRFDQNGVESANRNVPITMPEVSPADDIFVFAAIQSESIIRIDSRIVAQSLAAGMLISSASIMIGSIETTIINLAPLFQQQPINITIRADAGLMIAAAVQLSCAAISCAHLAYERFRSPPSANENRHPRTVLVPICGAMAGMSAMGAAGSLIRWYNANRIDSASQFAIHGQLPLGLWLVRRACFAQSQSGDWLVTMVAIAIATIGGSQPIIGAIRPESDAVTITTTAPEALFWWYGALCAQIGMIACTRQGLTRRGVDCRISIAILNAICALAFVVATIFVAQRSSPTYERNLIITVPGNAFSVASLIAGSAMQYTGTYLTFATNRFAASVTTAAGIIGGREQSFEIVWSIRIASETITLMIAHCIINGGRLELEPLSANVIVTQAILIPLMLTNESRICAIGATILRSTQSTISGAARSIAEMRYRATQRITIFSRSIIGFVMRIGGRIREAIVPNRVRYVRFRGPQQPNPRGGRIIRRNSMLDDRMKL